jgi:lipopolysaccharide exporter
MIYRFSGWRPTLVFHWPSAQGLVSFGIPFQINDVVNFVKDAITPVFVGIYSGNSAVGYVTWARNFAFAPIVLSEGFTKVSFPAFSRIQDEKGLLASTVELSFRCITLVMFPVTTMAFVFGPEITRIVFTEKWLPGITAFYFYCTSPFIIGIMVPMYNAILALGRTRILLKLGILLLFLEWGLGIPLVLRFGYTGIAMNQPVIGFIFFFLYSAVLKKEGIHVTLWKNILPQLCSALLAGILVKGASMLLAVNAASIVLLSAFGALVYLAAIYLFAAPLLHEFANYSRQIFRPSKAA